MSTLGSVGFTLAGGSCIAAVAISLFGCAVRAQHPAIAPRATARPREVIYNPHPSHPSQDRGSPTLGWIRWALHLDYDTMLRGVPGTGTRRGGLEGSMLKVNLDGIVLLRFHALCLRVSAVAMFLLIVFIMPMYFSAQCYRVSAEEAILKPGCASIAYNLTAYERLTIANVPSLSDAEAFSTIVNAGHRGILARLYFVVFAFWIITGFLVHELKREWVQVLAMRRVYFLESDVWGERREELKQTMLYEERAKRRREKLMKMNVRDNPQQISHELYQDAHETHLSVRDPWIPHPEQRDTVTNVSLYSVLVGGLPSLPQQAADAINEEVMVNFTKRDSIDWQLSITSTFFDHCVPNQPGFSSSVAAVTIIPAAGELSTAWRKWYAAAAKLRRLRFIRQQIAERRQFELDLEEGGGNSTYHAYAQTDHLLAPIEESEGYDETARDIYDASRNQAYHRQVLGTLAEEDFENTIYDAFGPEQTSIYSREFAQSAALFCPNGCNEYRVRTATIDELLELEREAAAEVHEANLQLKVARQRATVTEDQHMDHLTGNTTEEEDEEDDYMLPSEDIALPNFQERSSLALPQSKQPLPGRAPSYTYSGNLQRTFSSDTRLLQPTKRGIMRRPSADLSELPNDLRIESELFNRGSIHEMKLARHDSITPRQRLLSRASTHSMSFTEHRGTLGTMSKMAAAAATVSAELSRRPSSLEKITPSSSVMTTSSHAYSSELSDSNNRDNDADAKRIEMINLKRDTSRHVDRPDVVTLGVRDSSKTLATTNETVKRTRSKSSERVKESEGDSEERKSRRESRKLSRSRSREKSRKASRSESREKTRKASRSKSREKLGKVSRSKSREKPRKVSRSESREKSRKVLRSESQERSRKRSRDKLKSKSRRKSRSKSREKSPTKSRGKSRSTSRRKHRSESRLSRKDKNDEKLKSKSRSVSRDKTPKSTPNGILLLRDSSLVNISESTTPPKKTTEHSKVSVPDSSKESSSDANKVSKGSDTTKQTSTDSSSEVKALKPKRKKKKKDDDDDDERHEKIKVRKKKKKIAFAEPDPGPVPTTVDTKPHKSSAPDMPLDILTPEDDYFEDEETGLMLRRPMSSQWNRVESILLEQKDADLSDGILVDGQWHWPSTQTLRNFLDRAKLAISRTRENTKEYAIWAKTQSTAAVENISRESTYAVVTFTSRQAAVAARQCLSDGRGANRWMTIDEMPIPPLADAAACDLIVFRNCSRPVTLSINDRQKNLRNQCALAMLGVIYFFYTIPLTLASDIVTLRVEEYFPALAEFQRDRRIQVSAVLSGMVSAAIWSSFFAACPLIFKSIANFGSKATSVAHAEFKALQYFWWFMVVTAFTGPLLASMALSGFNNGIQIGSELRTVLRAVARTIPSGVSANTFIFEALGLNVCRRLVSGGGAGGSAPYRIYVDSGTVLMCSLALAPASPLVAPASFLYFLVCQPLLRRNFIFLYRPKFDGGGLRFPFLFDMTISALIVGQILLTTQMGLKQAIGPAIAACLPIPFTIMFSHNMKARYLRAFKDAGLLQTSLLDGWDTAEDTSEERREEFRRFLVDAHKAAFVPVCIAGTDTDSMLTAEPAVVVPLESDLDKPPETLFEDTATLDSSYRGSLPSSPIQSARTQHGATLRRAVHSLTARARRRGSASSAGSGTFNGSLRDAFGGSFNGSFARGGDGSLNSSIRDEDFISPFSASFNMSNRTGSSSGNLLRSRKVNKRSIFLKL